jgi:hypothetical protein
LKLKYIKARSIADAAFSVDEILLEKIYMKTFLALQL